MNSEKAYVKAIEKFKQEYPGLQVFGHQEVLTMCFKLGFIAGIEFCNSEIRKQKYEPR